MKRRSLTTMAAVGVAALSTLALASPANAATGAHPVSPAAVSPAYTPAPMCVTGTVDPWGYVSFTVHVFNGCRTTQRVKIIIAFGPDGSCETYPSHYGFAQKFYQGRFDGLATC